MSLPPALAARLAKRGILAKNQLNEEHVQPQIEEEEEVIAEDYDDANNKTNNEPIYDSKIYPTVSCCPHKSNIYHTCSLYCVRQYSDLPKEPSKEIKRKFNRILKDYPLGDTAWEKVYDPGLKTYYFWNIETDQVSWWPPSHSKFKISMPAEKLRKLLLKDEHNDTVKEKNNNKNPGNENLENGEENYSDDDEDDDDENDEDEDDDNDDDDEDDDDDESDSDDNISEVEEKFNIAKRRRPEISRRNDLDPMDPAAYSNIPRGKWSDGLKEARKE